MTSIVIFAAGRGTRLGRGLPKILIEVAGRPLFAHQLEALGHCEGEIYVVCGYRGGLVCDRIMNWGLGDRVSFILNRDYEKPQAGSIRRALEAIPHDRPALFIDGDLLFRAETITELSTREQTMVLVRRNVSADAVMACTNGRSLIRFERSGAGDLEWGNVALYQPDALRALEEEVRIPGARHHFELINGAVSRGMRCEYQVAELAEIDEPADFPAAEAFVAGGLQPAVSAKESIYA